MLKGIIWLFLAVLLLNPIQVLAEPSDAEKKTFEELAKDLDELNKAVIQLQKQLERMTPEERKQWCKDMKEKMEKSPPPIPIQFNCD